MQQVWENLVLGFRRGAKSCWLFASRRWESAQVCQAAHTVIRSMRIIEGCKNFLSITEKERK